MKSVTMLMTGQQQLLGQECGAATWSCQLHGLPFMRHRTAAAAHVLPWRRELLQQRLHASRVVVSCSAFEATVTQSATNGGEEGAGVVEAVKGKFPCIRLRGLPYSVKFTDVCDFMDTLPIDFVREYKNGLFTGAALLLLPSGAAVQKALLKNQQYLADRYVGVEQASKQDYYRAVAAAVAARAGVAGKAAVGATADSGTGSELSGCVLRLRGLPFTATAEDIVRFFQEGDPAMQPPLLSGVLFLRNRDGRPSGQALVRCADVEAAARGLALHRRHLGSRYVEIYPAIPEEVAAAGF